MIVLDSSCITCKMVIQGVTSSGSLCCFIKINCFLGAIFALGFVLRNEQKSSGSVIVFFSKHTSETLMNRKVVAVCCG